MEAIILAAVLVMIVLLVICLVQMRALRNGSGQGRQLRETQKELEQEIRESRQETLRFVQGSFKGMSDILATGQQRSAEAQDKRLAELNRRFSNMAIENEQKLEHIRQTVEQRLTVLTEENSRHMEKMRATVDENLQKTLESRINQSFRLVSERLEQVYKGLGEMQNLASGAGDLKKVLSNVKTRGVLGEIQTVRTCCEKISQRYS